jgi:hypothetical protein
VNRQDAKSAKVRQEKRVRQDQQDLQDGLKAKILSILLILSRFPSLAIPGALGVLAVK